MYGLKFSIIKASSLMGLLAKSRSHGLRALIQNVQDGCRGVGGLRDPTWRAALHSGLFIVRRLSTGRGRAKGGHREGSPDFDSFVPAEKTGVLS